MHSSIHSSQSHILCLVLPFFYLTFYCWNTGNGFFWWPLVSTLNSLPKEVWFIPFLGQFCCWAKGFSLISEGLPANWTFRCAVLNLKMFCAGLTAASFYWVWVHCDLLFPSLIAGSVLISWFYRLKQTKKKLPCESFWIPCTEMGNKFSDIQLACSAAGLRLSPTFRLPSSSPTAKWCFFI